MSAFDQAWDVAKGASDYERSVAEEFAEPADMKVKGKWDDAIDNYQGMPDFEERWHNEDTCACNTEDEEADELEAAYMAKYGLKDPSEIDWMDDEVYRAGYRRDAKWMKHGPTFYPNSNTIHASCGHCGSDAYLDLDPKEGQVMEWDIH